MLNKAIIKKHLKVLNFYAANCSIILTLVNTLFMHMPRLFIDNLTVIDCSVLDPERGLIGASWAVDIELLGELDHQSMVFDFAKVKKTIKRIIDDEVDHKLVVPSKFSGTKVISNSENDNLHIEFIDNTQEFISHKSPKQAVCLIDCEHVNRDAVIHYLNDLIMKELPDNVQQLIIELHEENVKGNYYRYSHGLEKHDGNCQRIAHGHRSQIQIWHDGKRHDQLETIIADKWHDIYLGSTEHVIKHNNGRIEFRYTTDQGLFELSLPEHRIHLMNCDSTVECIADHLLELIRQDYSEITKKGALKVKAFEGIGKGAISTAEN